MPDHPLPPRLTIRGLHVRAVDVPLLPPVQTAAGAVTSAPLVLVDLMTEEGVTGSAYVFCYARLALGPTAQLVQNLEPLVQGQALAPLSLSRSLAARFRLLGPQGLTGIALAALDMAAWDAQARALDVPLARLLGAGGDERIPAYASLRGWTPGELAEEAGQAVAAGFTAVKLKFGHARIQDELEVLHAVRGAIGDGPGIMVDYNQARAVPEAIARAHVLDDYGLTWIEEPVRADDYAGHAAVARQARTPIQVGENYWGPHELARSISAHASDYVMPEVMKMGGVTGWSAAAAQAEAAGLPVSSHIFAEFSAHVLAAAATRHWLEWLDVAGAILVDGPRVDGGYVTPGRRPGAGLVWDEDAIARFSVI